MRMERTNLVEARLKRFMSQDDLGELINMSGSGVGCLERGIYNPKPRIQEILENYFSIPREVLFKLSESNHIEGQMKNKYEVRGDVTAIFLKSQKYGDMETLITTSKLERAKEFPRSWYPCMIKNVIYVLGHTPRINGESKVMLLHRWITNAVDGLVVDHINHDTLNNTDENLREATISENAQNRKGNQSNNISGVRGVNWRKDANKWRAEIQLNSKHVHIGYFDDIKDAEKAVKEARAKHMPYSQEALAN